MDEPYSVVGLSEQEELFGWWEKGEGVMDELVMRVFFWRFELVCGPRTVAGRPTGRSCAETR